MSDLVAFLRARLDEDEALAAKATEGPWSWEPTGDKDNSWAVGRVQDEDGNDLMGQLDPGQGIVIDGVCESIDGRLADGAHIARHDPARVLREVEAKRAILARYEDTLVRQEDPDYPAGVARDQAREYEDFVLPNLAAVYRDHPDYDPGWAP